jgi:sirohydrochlorin ferrochelatase
VTPQPTVILFDNGSLRPAASLSLRGIAAALSAVAGLPVEPISLLHSSAVQAEALDGQPAEILEPALERRLASGIEEFVLLPLFFGPSAAIVDYIPRRMAALQAKWPRLSIRLGPPLVDIEAPGDLRMAGLLADLVEQRAQVVGFKAPWKVALVDHGTPQRPVAAVRNRLATQLGTVLGSRASAVAACSMERREGAEYDFNEPLLAGLLDTPPFDHGQVIVSMLFLSPGRHAGPDGDVAEICAGARGRHPGLTTEMAPLVGSHPGLIPLLAERLSQALASQPLTFRDAGA